VQRERWRRRCELLKNLALMGVATDGGEVTLTDDDVIEKSNLSRQFLFRDWDLKQAKSTAAARAAIAINPAFKVSPQVRSRLLRHPPTSHASFRPPGDEGASPHMTVGRTVLS